MNAYRRRILQSGRTNVSMKLFARHKTFGSVFGIIMLAVLLAACGNPGGGAGSPPSGTTPQAATNGKNCTKVGVLLPETSTSPRWDTNDRPALQKDIQAIPGVTVDYANAEGDAAKQQTQADAAMTKGDCILVIAPSDASAAGAIVTKAKSKGIPVISYDRLIQSAALNYYVSFDGVQVGEIQGQYIVDHYKDYIKPGHTNVVMINGAQTDNNALLFRQGTLNKLQPLFDNKTLAKVYDQYTPNWSDQAAHTEMDGVLTAKQADVQIAYVANDSMANSVIASLKAKKLNGKVLVTGQDATVAGIQNILTGDQAMTVYKAIPKEAQAAADLVKALHDGTDTSTLTKGITIKTQDGTAIPSILETPVAVDKSNIASTVIADGYVTKAQVCQNLPAGAGGIC